jgi:poly-gamma-glutamate synthesis protein (capsule biosynthesis protein)
MQYMWNSAFVAVMIGIPLYVMGVFVSHAVAPERMTLQTTRPVVLTFVGDMMFDRYVREQATQHGYDAILAGVASLFASSSMVVGNLEGPISTFAAVSNYRQADPNHYRFTFATTTASLLARTGFSAVSLGNNHSLNFGSDGLAQTKEWLLANHVGYFGAPDDPYTPWRGAAGTVSVIVYAYDLWHANDLEALKRRIEAEDQDAFIVVFAHWGDEYHTEPNLAQQDVAHALVDAGADLVVGAHPHVIQTKEQYHGKWIYYSLGNFVFDQYFSDAVRCGAVLHVAVEPSGTYVPTESFIELARDGTTQRSTCALSVPLSPGPV